MQSKGPIHTQRPADSTTYYHFIRFVHRTSALFWQEAGSSSSSSLVASRVAAGAP